MNVDWDALIEDDDLERAKQEAKQEEAEDDDWRQEAADSLCELYYESYRAQKRGGVNRIDLRPGSDYKRFVETFMEPLGDYGVWEVLFPNRISATSAQAIDEALHLLGDSKLVDRIFSGDIITVNKLIQSIKKKRAKYLEM